MSGLHSTLITFYTSVRLFEKDKTNISGNEKKISTGTEGDVCINNVFCYNENGIKDKNTLCPCGVQSKLRYLLKRL